MRKYILALIIIFAISLSGCSDWLDVPPAGQNREKEQYSTEININSTLNGIYMMMAGNNLYGGKLTMTTIEHFAHYYYVPSDITTLQNDYQLFYNLQNYRYDESEVEKTIKPIWSEAYNLIFQINQFIKNVTDTKVVSTEKRDVLLGEAYALRAFMHFDIFRLFGSIYDDTEQQILLPYNDYFKINSGQQLAPKDYIDKVLADINTAEDYLKNDPILTDGVKIPDTESAPIPITEKFATYLRSKRLNLIATKALKARVLTYTGQLDEAAKVAQNIIDMPDMIENINAGNNKAVFKWIEFNDINASDKKDMIFSSEVLFGIENPDLYSRWKNYTESTKNGKAYIVNNQNLLTNILNTSEPAPYLVSDVRAKYQWTLASSLGSDVYRSMKFTEFAGTEKRLSHYMQPLMRISELYYIIIENHIQNGRLNEAINLLNSLLRRRGYKSNEEINLNTSAMALKDVLKQEYYREFFAEGQAFFYLKRTKSKTIYRSYGAGTMTMKLSNYVVPIPKDQINN